MRSFIAESGVEEVCLDYFADLGWDVLYGPDIAPGRSSCGACQLSRRPLGGSSPGCHRQSEPLALSPPSSTR